MKILVVGKFYVEGFALHIAETLQALGHEVRRFEPGLRSGGPRLGHRIGQVVATLHNVTDSVPSVRARRMRSLWDEATADALDLALVTHDFLLPREVAELKRRTKARVALWFPDAIANFGRALFMNAPYDALFFKDPYIVHALGDVLASPVHYLPECFNPARHSLPEGAAADPRFVCDIVTAGNQHSWRVAFFKHLAEYDVRIWGNPAPQWMPVGSVAAAYQGRPIYDQEKALAFRSARVVVNNLHPTEIWGANARTFEAAGAGAFQMVDWRPGLEQLFADGRELVTFRGMADLGLKLREWLPREAERRAIAEAGRRRAQKDHTYALRMQLLIDTLFGDARGFPSPLVASSPRDERRG